MAGSGMMMFVDSVLDIHGNGPIRETGEYIDDRLAKRGIYTDNDHTGCMRYVTGFELEEDGLIVDDFGGYWRTSEKPRGSDSDENKKFLANLGSGKPVEPELDELAKAFKGSVGAAAEMYESWVEDERPNPSLRVEPL